MGKHVKNYAEVKVNKKQFSPCPHTRLSHRNKAIGAVSYNLPLLVNLY